MSTYPDLLYHTVLTVIDYHDDPSGAKRSVYVLGTHATLKASKAFAATTALGNLKYDSVDFEEYAVHSSSPFGSEAWTHGDGVIVYARAPAGQVFLVGIYTTSNNESLQARTSDGTVVFPVNAAAAPDEQQLHYVVQTTTDYNRDRSGGVQETEIEGCYIQRDDALAAARKCLDSSSFVEFDVREEDSGVGGDWPFDEDVVVHAVAGTGQNTTVTVRTVPDALKRHGKQ
ncbi:hypothetical protein BGZ63DRAFT_412375 [Mariannaea sp. PMI_226]|nr:hypothetical protein BGZ63DRAFT_412375 [Mariannaea sp. PMI_226]